MLKLAEEFLDKGYKGFAKLSDLNKIGSGWSSSISNLCEI